MTNKKIDEDLFKKLNESDLSEMSLDDFETFLKENLDIKIL